MGKRIVEKKRRIKIEKEVSVGGGRRGGWGRGEGGEEALPLQPNPLLRPRRQRTRTQNPGTLHLD